MAAAAIPLIGQVASGLLGLWKGNKAAHAQALANNDAMQGVLNTAKSNSDAVIQAGDSARGLVDAKTNDANATLQRTFEGQRDNLNPYLDTGHTAANSLEQYIQSKPTFSFNYDDYKNDPAYQFELNKGSDAIQNASSSRGLLQGGGTLKALTEYGQGLAATHYGDAFKRAQQQFQTNQDATLANLTAGVNTGLAGTREFDTAAMNNGNQQAGNTVNSGYFGGSTENSIAQFLANYNSQAARDAGNYRVGQGAATAAGEEGGAQTLGAMIQGVGNGLPGLFGKKVTPGSTNGRTTTLPTGPSGIPGYPG